MNYQGGSFDVVVIFLAPDTPVQKHRLLAAAAFGLKPYYA